MDRTMSSSAPRVLASTTRESEHAYILPRMFTWWPGSSSPVRFVRHFLVEVEAAFGTCRKTMVGARSAGPFPSSPPVTMTQAREDGRPALPLKFAQRRRQEEAAASASPRGSLASRSLTAALVAASSAAAELSAARIKALEKKEELRRGMPERAGGTCGEPGRVDALLLRAI